MKDPLFLESSQYDLLQYGPREAALACMEAARFIFPKDTNQNGEPCANDQSELSLGRRDIRDANNSGRTGEL